MKWVNIHNDHVKPTVSFGMSKDEKLRQILNWRNMQRLIKIDNLQKGGKFDFSEYGLHFIEA